MEIVIALIVGLINKINELSKGKTRPNFERAFHFIPQWLHRIMQIAMSLLLNELETHGKERNYPIAFISLLMPLVFFFIPQLFSPLVIIKSYILGVTPPNANYYTIEDIASLIYLLVGCSLGIMTLTFPNKHKLSKTVAIIGVIINIFSFIGTLIYISVRLERMPPLIH